MRLQNLSTTQFLPTFGDGGLRWRYLASWATLEQKPVPFLVPSRFWSLERAVEVAARKFSCLDLGSLEGALWAFGGGEGGLGVCAPGYNAPAGGRKSKILALPERRWRAQARAYFWKCKDNAYLNGGDLTCKCHSESHLSKLTTDLKNGCLKNSICLSILWQ